MLRTQICISRTDQASDSGTMAMSMACAWRLAADSGSTPTPTPASIMRQAVSKLPTWMRSLIGRCSWSLAWRRKAWMALDSCSPT